MKKLWAVTFLALFSVPRSAHAWISSPLVQQEKTVMVHLSTTVAINSNPATFDLVQLVNTSNLFPHLDRGEIDIMHVNVMVDKVATSTGSVRFGIVNFVNQSTGSASFFYTCSWQKNTTNNSLPFTDYFAPGMLRGRVLSGKTATNSDVDGRTPFFTTNEKRSGSVIYTSSTTNFLQSPAGFVTPGVGDVVMEVANFDSINPIFVWVELYYHSEP